MCNCCESGIYIGNDGINADVAIGGFVPFGDPTWRYGNAIKVRDNSIVLCGANKAFEIEGTFTIEAASAGPLTVTVLQDGVPVPGGVFTIAVAGTSAQTLLPIRTVVKNECKCSSTITFQVSQLAVTIDAESLEVKTWGC